VRLWWKIFLEHRAVMMNKALRNMSNRLLKKLNNKDNKAAPKERRQKNAKTRGI
jgi:hypothetical protein